MRIGTIGTGNMASTLGKLWATRGHEIMFGSRDPSRAQAVAESIEGSAAGGSNVEAAAFGEVVLLATPWTATEETVAGLGSLAGRVLIDCTNPFENLELVVDSDTSAGELVAQWAPGARVVKAFNTIHFHTLADPKFGVEPAVMFFCGDDAEAKQVVAQLGQDIGLKPLDGGPLKNARLLEPMALFWVRMAFVEGHGKDTAYGWLVR